ncbi:MFS transporter [Longirhabdus pacifica]|uniref:MFS transporter n=1 Tax=Longirhabdus pacifica TaxID=2305227 RepID=UPI0013E8B4FD|nr:MFS transporter [Longirhabdus pacifica]
MILKDKRLHAILTANLFSSIGLGISGTVVTWNLIQSANGAQLYGYVIAVMNITMFLILPYLGTMVDRYSRKKVIIFAEVFGLTITFLVLCFGYVSQGLDVWHFVVLLMLSYIYYPLQIPAKIALCQEIFDASQYRTLNSALEIQGQTAAMISAGITALAMKYLSLFTILWIDVLTYVIAISFIMFIPYTAKQSERLQKSKAWANISEGFMYLKNRKRLLLFLLGTFIPFVMVMIGNYINPIHIKDTLGAGLEVFASFEMFYAIGAILAGFMMTILMKKYGDFTACFTMMIIFTIGMMSIIIIPNVAMLLVASLLFGLGNAGTRVGRNVIMMKIVPNDIIGRVSSFVQGMGLLIRTTSIFILSSIIHQISTLHAFSVMTFMLLLALFAVWKVRDTVIEDKVSVTHVSV